MFEVYKPSGSIGFKTWPLLIGGIVLAGVMAFAYRFVLEWNPIIYITFLITLAMGVGLAMIGSFIVTKGHCRNLIAATLIGLVLVAVGLGGKFWFQYQSVLADAAVHINNDPGIPSAVKDVALAEFRQQFTFLEHLKARADIGWNVGRNGGMPVAGIFVYLIWAIEAGVLLFFGFKIPRSAASEPYSEKMGTWADEAQTVMMLPITDSEMVAKIKSASSVEDLLEIPIPKTDESNRFAVYTVNSIPGQELEDAYLSVMLITYSVNNKGEQETDETPLVKHAILSSENRKQLIENAELLQEAMAEFRASADQESEESDQGEPIVDASESENQSGAG